MQCKVLFLQSMEEKPRHTHHPLHLMSGVGCHHGCWFRLKPSCKDKRVAPGHNTTAHQGKRLQEQQAPGNQNPTIQHHIATRLRPNFRTKIQQCSTDSVPTQGG